MRLECIVGLAAILATSKSLDPIPNRSSMGHVPDNMPDSNLVLGKIGSIMPSTANQFSMFVRLSKAWVFFISSRSNTGEGNMFPGNVCQGCS